jgi:hypothetical protein
VPRLPALPVEDIGQRHSVAVPFGEHAGGGHRSLREVEGGSMSEWISVDVRLPEKNSQVLVFCGDYRPSEQRVFCVAQWWDTYYGDALWHESLTGERMIHGVTHWMPLPEKPKGA